MRQAHGCFLHASSKDVQEDYRHEYIYVMQESNNLLIKIRTPVILTDVIMLDNQDSLLT